MTWRAGNGEETGGDLAAASEGRCAGRHAVIDGCALRGLQPVINLARRAHGHGLKICPLVYSTNTTDTTVTAQAARHYRVVGSVYNMGPIRATPEAVRFLEEVVKISRFPISVY